MTTYRDFPPCPPGVSPQAWAIECKTLRTLDNLSLGYTNKANQYQGLVIEDARCARVVEGQQERLRWVEMDLQVNPLPFGVDIDKIANDRVRRTLQAVVYGDVTIKTERGVTIRVDFEKKGSQQNRLPVHAGWRWRYAPPRGVIYIPMGMSEAGPVWQRLEDLKHTLVIGHTGAGKSLWLQMLTMWLLYRHTPQEVNLLILDAKNPDNPSEFAMWDGIAHLMQPIAHDARGIIEALDHLRAEVKRRLSLFSSVKARDIGDYFTVTRERLPRLVVVFDEFLALSDSMTRADKTAFLKEMANLAYTARSSGVHMFFGAQDTKAADLDTSIAYQFIHRVGFRLFKEETAVRLEVPGAGAISESTPGRFVTNIGGLRTLQGYFITGPVLRDAADRIRAAYAAPSPGPRRQLTDDELRMCQIARDQLAGNFTVGNDTDGIYGVTGPAKRGGMSKRLIEKTGQEWEKRGWLAKVGGENGQGWVMLPELLDIVKSDEQIKKGEGK
jgi:energy-coupling factor transporter ATP-binding protein EcfA2